MEKVDYDDRQHAVYAQGRAVSPAMITTWMNVFAGHAPASRPEETAQGFAAPDAAVAAEASPQPVGGVSDLLVLG